MTKQFLLAAAPPPRGGGILLQLSSKQLAKPTAFGALTAATETAIDDHQTALKAAPDAAPAEPYRVTRKIAKPSAKAHGTPSIRAGIIGADGRLEGGGVSAAHAWRVSLSAWHPQKKRPACDRTPLRFQLYPRRSSARHLILK
jgi:hypothetical protein